MHPLRESIHPYTFLIADMAQVDRLSPPHAALGGENDASLATAFRTANANINRVTPLMIMLMPTNVPIAHLELDGHCR